MPDKRFILGHRNFHLSPETIRALQAKEALIRGDAPQEEELHGDWLIGSGAALCYVFFTRSGSDSANTRDYACGFSRIVSDPFGDEESLRVLYAEFAEEERALANEGLSEFRQVMSEYDGE